MTRTVALIQARMSSTRFPGKVLQPLAGMPSILYMIERVRRARLPHEVAVVTSTDASDDPLAQVLADASVPLWRGELDDVLARYAGAARAFEASEVVRLTGDCPLIDPGVIDAVIALRRQRSTDYAGNTDPATYPDGLDVECFTREALERAIALARRPSEREHVTLWMRDAGSGCTRANLQAIADFSALRLTVDYPDDLEVVRALLRLLPASGDFDLFDILRALGAHPALADPDRHARNEGLALSLAREDQP
jgi:spore coat polysaccharide biosynthesis protein SpsF (cytidylyltransferase family)